MSADHPESWITGEDIDGVEFINPFPACQLLPASDYERETVLADRILYRRR